MKIYKDFCNMLWYKPYTLTDLKQFHTDSMVEHLGIEFTEIGVDYLVARMPASPHTKQPLGIIHGGANVVLAESLGSLATYLCLNPDTHTCVGLEINANHVRAVKEGFVYGTTRPLHTGRKTHIWEIHIKNEAGQLTCVSRITNMILEKAAHP